MIQQNNPYKPFKFIIQAVLLQQDENDEFREVTTEPVVISGGLPALEEYTSSFETRLQELNHQGGINGDKED